MNIVIYGTTGKMGASILNLARKDDGFKVVAALERGAYLPEDLDAFLMKTDAVIDFTNPESTLANLEYAKKCKVAVVIGTTGFSEEQSKKIETVSKIIPIVLSPNMSRGVNILFKLVREAAEKMSDYDMEILELHHSKKKDSPSGTAAKLAEIIASSKNKDINEVVAYGRHDANTLREKDEVGMFSIRAGDIVGEHTVYFAGQGERVELTHRASSRDTFASGALKAAKWVLNQKPGLYDMFDVLSLK